MSAETQFENNPTIVKKVIDEQKKLIAYNSGKTAKHKGWSRLSPFINEQLTPYFNAGFDGVEFPHD